MAKRKPVTKVKFIKYFHELTEEEFKTICKKHPHMTHGELAVAYPQPPWCDYPDAVFGMMGCWSLIGFMVTGKKYCRGCDCLIKAARLIRSRKGEA